MSAYTGHEEISRAARYLEWLNLSFTERYTAEQLLAIWRAAMAHPEWPEMADEWSAEQLRQALRGKP